MINITDDDIKKVEAVFLAEGKTFDIERRAAIKATDTIDILACAGSGKTTVLAAKLAILANKLPLPDGRGICVITHTNVAIKEVLNKLGMKGNILFNYPNFFGTIQSFADKFLATPAYSMMYGKRPSRIDDEHFSYEVDKRYHRLGWSAKGWLQNSRPRDYLEFLKSIRFSCRDRNILVPEIGCEKPLFVNQQCNSCADISTFKKTILQDGFLCYDDAYTIAFEYLRLYKDNLQNALSERFGFVFIDEMQDTDLHQIKLLDELFKSSVVIQRIGDINQSIYSVGRDDTVWSVRSGYKALTGSKRFSNAIAKQVENLCIQKLGINGNHEIPDIVPKILIFDDTTKDKIFPAFGKLILENNLHQCTRKVYKAIGWVGKPSSSGHRTITDYWAGFDNGRKLRKSERDYLCDYLFEGTKEAITSEGLNYYRKSVVHILIKILRISEIRDERKRYFTEWALLEYLREEHNEFYSLLLHRIADWGLKIQRGVAVVDEVRDFVCNQFINIFQFDITKVSTFIYGSGNSPVQPSITSMTTPCNSNIYKFSDEISIEIATVHSVKGETHTATLYLETFHKAYDMKRILPFLCNRSVKPKPLTFSTLKVAYVGMTRPTHLLCVAIHRDTVAGQEKNLVKAGWDCITLV